MPRPIPAELRQRVVEAVQSGEDSYTEAAARFKVGRASVSRWVRSMRESGSIAPQPMGGSKSPLDDDTREVLRWLVWSQPDATLRELLLCLEHETGIRTNDSSLSRVLKEMGLTRKKSRSSTIGVRIAT